MYSMKILCTRTNRNLWFIVENNDVEDGVHPIGYESYKKADEIAKLLQRHEKLDEYEILSQKEPCKKEWPLPGDGTHPDRQGHVGIQPEN